MPKDNIHFPKCRGHMYICIIVYASDQPCSGIPPGQLQPEGAIAVSPPHLLKSRTYQLIQHRPRTPMKKKLLNKSTQDLEHTNGAKKPKSQDVPKNLEKANHLHNMELLGFHVSFRKCTP